jgi:hypothetical protein
MLAIENEGFGIGESGLSDRGLSFSRILPVQISPAEESVVGIRVAGVVFGTDRPASSASRDK